MIDISLKRVLFYNKQSLVEVIQQLLYGMNCTVLYMFVMYYQEEENLLNMMMTILYKKALVK